MASAFSELFKHNLWAKLPLLDVCTQLDEVQLDATVLGTYGSIRDTFVHLIATEGRYVVPLSDQRPRLDGWEYGKKMLGA